MPTKEWAKTWHDPHLDLRLLEAHYVRHAYPRHSHDYYVICLIDRGRQSFTHRGTKYFTPAGGVILINPGAAHTGEPADAHGFQMRSLYPTVAHMQMAVEEVTGRHGPLPFFNTVRVDQPGVRRSLAGLHNALAGPAGFAAANALECESRFVWTLAELAQQFADSPVNPQRLGRETAAVQRAREYIDESFAEGLRLGELAAHVGLSPYYLLRAFRAEVGLPPHAYLESVRIRQAQKLIEARQPLAQVAAEVGFSSQSHLNQRFKKIIGVTPGQYARQPGDAAPC
jgi:AraC-like DNA-binding protein